MGFWETSAPAFGGSQRTPSMSGPILELREPPLFQGSNRFVYRHPGDDSALVKVPKCSKPVRGRFSRQRIPVGVAENLREFSECLRLPGEERLCSVRGFALTNGGWGLVVGAETKGGEIAPTLLDLRRAGALSTIREDIRSFLSWARQTTVVFNDLNLTNIVLGENGLRLVDGFGEKALLRLRTNFPWLARHNNARLLDRLEWLLSRPPPAKAIEIARQTPRCEPPNG